jgi:hypothetical protein
MHALINANQVLLNILCVLFDLHITCSSSFVLYGSINADWAGSTIDDRKSTGEYIVYFIIHRFLRNQENNAQLLVTEAEYKALVDDTAEVLWL